jgi:hypothetical protein
VDGKRVIKIDYKLHREMFTSEASSENFSRFDTIKVSEFHIFLLIF